MSDAFKIELVVKPSNCISFDYSKIPRITNPFFSSSKIPRKICKRNLRMSYFPGWFRVWTIWEKKLSSDITSRFSYEFSSKWRKGSLYAGFQGKLKFCPRAAFLRCRAWRNSSSVLMRRELLQFFYYFLRKGMMLSFLFWYSFRSFQWSLIQGLFISQTAFSITSVHVRAESH